METTLITIQTLINAPVEKVWNLWTEPAHITKWASPSPEWHTPSAQHDLKKGGNFLFRMEARDGSQGFDFGGVYDEVRKNDCIEYTIGDGRKVSVKFTTEAGRTKVVEAFEAESENPVDMQRAGWQAMLDNFKSYVEAN